MEYQFVNKCELLENSAGKIILCKKENEIALYGNLKVLEQIRDMSLEDAKKELMHLCIDKDEGGHRLMEGLVGKHEYIVHGGSVLGGTQALVKEGVLYAMFESVSYGPINPEALEKCLSTSSLKLEHKHLDLLRSLPSFDEFIG